MSEIVEKAKKHVINLLTTKLNSNYLYHNLRHTERVVKNTKDLVDHYQIKEKEDVFLLAAWFS